MSDQTIQWDRRDLEDMVEALAEWVPALLDEPRASLIVDACRQAATAAPPSFVEAVAHVEAAAHAFSRHLLLFVQPSGSMVPDDHDRGWPPGDPREVRRRGGGVRTVTRTDEYITTIELDSLEPFVTAQPQIDAAITLARDATGIVLDLRRNGGGDPATVARVAGFLLGPEPQRLSTVFGRDGHVQEWETAPPNTDLCLPEDVRVAVLVSRRTFSSGEALAYHLQVRGRVRVFGQTTPGAADHVSPFVLTPYVYAQLPIARVVDAVTASNWEAVGVRPDHLCEADEAHAAAIEWFRQTPAQC